MLLEFEEDLMDGGSTLKNGVEGTTGEATSEQRGAKGREKLKVPFGASKGLDAVEGVDVLVKS